MSRYVSKLQYWSLGYRTDSELCHARMLGTVKGGGWLCLRAIRRELKNVIKMYPVLQA